MSDWQTVGICFVISYLTVGWSTMLSVTLWYHRRHLKAHDKHLGGHDVAISSLVWRMNNLTMQVAVPTFAEPETALPGPDTPAGHKNAILVEVKSQVQQRLGYAQAPNQVRVRELLSQPGVYEIQIWRSPDLSGEPEIYVYALPDGAGPDDVEIPVRGLWGPPGPGSHL